jgi:hypothetical protein
LLPLGYTGDVPLGTAVNENKCLTNERSTNMKTKLAKLLLGLALVAKESVH